MGNRTYATLKLFFVEGLVTSQHDDDGQRASFVWAPTMEEAKSHFQQHHAEDMDEDEEPTVLCVSEVPVEKPDEAGVVDWDDIVVKEYDIYG